MKSFAQAMRARHDAITAFALLSLLLTTELRAEDFTYTNINGTVTITAYTGAGGAVSIPSTIAGLPVTRIGGLAFNNQSSVTSVTIPESVTSFESGLAPLGGAFGFCTGLTNIAIPNSVTNIGDYAFVFCTHMVGVYFQGNSPRLGAQVFQNDNNLTVFYLPGTTGWGPTFGGRPTAVWNQALDFTYTNTNGTVTITGYTGPGGVVTIPSSIDGRAVTSIGDGAFSGVSVLTGVTIPDSVTNLGERTFNGCSSLASLTIGSGISVIPGSANNGFGGTFAFCTSLTRVTIPDSVTKIGDGIVSKGGPLGVFYGCTSLTNVTVGRGLAYLGFGAFTWCTNLVGVYFRGNAPTPGQGQGWFGEEIFYGTPAIAYYLPGTTGWGAGASLGGRPAVLWNPQMQTGDGSFGVRQNRFGFNITGTADIPLVVEATTNLTPESWVPSQSCTLTNGFIYFSDAEWTNYPGRFYRIRSP